MVRATCPDANGATMAASGNGACYCEFGQTGNNGSGSWQTAFVDVDDASATGDPHITMASGAKFDLKKSQLSFRQTAPAWETGDGISDRETHIGTAGSPQECAEMVRATCPDANGATLPGSGSGGCYCEFGQRGSTGSTSWQTAYVDVDDDASATGDPHITTASGVKFDLKKTQLGLTQERDDTDVAVWSGTAHGDTMEAVQIGTDVRCRGAEDVRKNFDTMGACAAEFLARGDITNFGYWGQDNTQTRLRGLCMGWSGACTTPTEINQRFTNILYNFREPIVIDAPVPAPVQDEASAVGDPHLTTLSGSKLDLCCEGGKCHSCL